MTDLRPGMLINSYKIIRKLSQGGFSVVYLASHIKTNELAALKCIPRQDDANRQSSLQALELKWHKILGSHENIIDFKGSFLTDHFFVLVLEYIYGADLCNVMYYETLEESDIKHIYSQLLKAVQYMHKKEVYHRDLKPENVLLDSSFNLRLIDFGLSTNDKLTNEFEVGTYAYMAPEVHNQNDRKFYSPRLSDMWSLGALFLSVCVGRPIWEKPSSCDYNYIMLMSDKTRSLTEYGFSNEVIAMLSRLLSFKPSDRISIDQLIEEFQQIDHIFIGKGSDSIHDCEGGKSFTSSTADFPTLVAGELSPYYSRSTVNFLPFINNRSADNLKALSVNQ